MNNDSPEIVLDSARVIAYAIVDESVSYIERGSLFVDGKLLGAVPRLAICQNFDEEDFMIFYCGHDWSVLGVAGKNSSVDTAKSKVERSYKGSMAKWIDVNVSVSEALAYLQSKYTDQKCSFCGRLPFSVEAMIGNTVFICNHCIDEFYSAIHK